MNTDYGLDYGIACLFKSSVFAQSLWTQVFTSIFSIHIYMGSRYREQKSLGSQIYKPTQGWIIYYFSHCPRKPAKELKPQDIHQLLF